MTPKRRKEVVAILREVAANLPRLAAIHGTGDLGAAEVREATDALESAGTCGFCGREVQASLKPMCGDCAGKEDPETARLRAEVERLNAYVRKHIADTGNIPASELLRMAEERSREMENLRSNLNGRIAAIASLEAQGDALRTQLAEARRLLDHERGARDESDRRVRDFRVEVGALRTDLAKAKEDHAGAIAAEQQRRLLAESRLAKAKERIAELETTAKTTRDFIAANRIGPSQRTLLVGWLSDAISPPDRQSTGICTERVTRSDFPGPCGRERPCPVHESGPREVPT